MTNVGRVGIRSGLLALAIAALFCATALVHPLGAAHADLFFCEDDPIVNINGVNVSITVGIAPDGLSRVHGAVPILIVVPEDVQAHVVFSTHQFLEEQVFIVHAEDAERMIRNVLRGDERADALAEVVSAHSTGRIQVLSEVLTGGEHDFRTRLYSDQSRMKVYGTSNHVMQLNFAVPRAHSSLPVSTDKP